MPTTAFSRLFATAALSLAFFLTNPLPAAPATIRVDGPGRPISPDLFGIFFEDLNYAADGGLYAELIQNRSFEYQATEQPTWNSLTSWEFTARGGGKGSWAVAAAEPIHPNNPHYLALHVRQPGAGVGVVNAGFDGIPIQAGEHYALSLFAKQLYLKDRWAPAPTGADAVLAAKPRDGAPGPLLVRLESKDGENLGEVSFDWPGSEWTHLTATITARRTEATARLVVLVTIQGGLALDVISLFPPKTFHDRPNGLRADLAQVIADLQPRFMRFPGGCLAHGDGLGNMYRWKDTIGPIEQRREQANLWGYHQTVGLGYFEFFQFCEDIGAKPLPVVPAGVCCQNSGQKGGTGQRCLPLDQMSGYVQEVLDLIEYANGPATSTWGAKRAAAGHPEPFHLEYLGVGNEDTQTPGFRERFKLIYDAVKAQHPEITVIGTVGPFPDGPDFDAGWKFADELQLGMVDEHYYQKPEWFLNNLHRYDSYDRAKSKVYLGEYAAHDTGRRNTLRSALAEAAHMTALERNGDIVRLASYAPLLAREGHTQWTPDLIYFNSARVRLTANYYVQQMFATNRGETCFSATVSTPTDGAAPTVPLAVSCVQDSATGDVLLKLVNANPAVAAVQVELPSLGPIDPVGTCLVLAGDPDAVNTTENPSSVVPQTASLAVGKSFHYEAPAYSLAVIRMKTR